MFFLNLNGGKRSPPDLYIGPKTGPLYSYTRCLVTYHPTGGDDSCLSKSSMSTSHPFLADSKTWHHWSTIGLFLLGNLYRHCSADALQAANTCVMLCLSSLNTVAFLAFHSMLDTTTFCSDLIDVTKQSAYVSIVIAETVVSVIGCVVLSPLSTRAFTFQ